MERIKKTLLISTALVIHLGLTAQPSQPFSPCSTDMQTISHKVVFHNNFSEAIGDYLTPISTITDATTSTPQDQPCLAEDEFSPITIQVNKKTLQNGEDIEIDVTKGKPLKVTLTGQVRTILGFLIKSDLLTELNSPLTQKIKDWTTSFIAKTYGLFRSDVDAEQIYENHKGKILTAYAQLYRNTIGLFSGNCEIEIIIDADKLCDDTVISFYRIIDEVIKRMDEPDRFKYNGSIYNPVIQIV